ncbi:hypothetical protein FHG87_001016 [Trinorchestia longiramus]|nr:hypothetical protein FHG87_001016 [Trinorchestia longiramus]
MTGDEGSSADHIEKLSQLLAASSQDVHQLQLQLQALQSAQEAQLHVLLEETPAPLCDFPRMFGDLTKYTQKAYKLQHDMKHISQRTEKLRTRVQRLVEEAERREEAASRERARVAERELLLLARPTWQP